MTFKSVCAVAILLTAPACAGNKNIQTLAEPTETKGVSIQVLQENDLAAQLPAFSGHNIRARRITFATGASFTKHNHAERPGIVYVERGSIVENRNGTARKFRAGETWIEKADTDHWLRNTSGTEAVIIMIDLPAQQ